MKIVKEKEGGLKWKECVEVQINNIEAMCLMLGK